MHDGGAIILDVLHPGSLGDRPRLRRDEPELEPEGLGAHGGRLLGDNRAKLGSAKDVHEVDRLVDLGQRLSYWDSEDLGAVGPNREHPVALLEQIPHH